MDDVLATAALELLRDRVPHLGRVVEDDLRVGVGGQHRPQRLDGAVRGVEALLGGRDFEPGVVLERRAQALLVALAEGLGVEAR